MLGSTCNFGLQDQYQVIFYNSAKFSIDVIWKNYPGNENLIMSKLAPGDEIAFATYFTHEWIFKSSFSNNRLLANANGITEDYFEGCHFKVEPKEHITVTLFTGKYKNNDNSMIIM